MKPFAGVRLLLERVDDAGIQVALASSANRDELNSYKKILDIVDLIDVETSADDAEKEASRIPTSSKPWPSGWKVRAGATVDCHRRYAP